MRKYEFDAAKTKDEIIAWIRNYFRKNGPDCNAVIGISGGKDSSIVAALCCECVAGQWADGWSVRFQAGSCESAGTNSYGDFVHGESEYEWASS